MTSLTTSSNTESLIQEGMPDLRSSIVSQSAAATGLSVRHERACERVLAD